MYAHELFEAGKPNVVVTYPGRFQPFHQGHAGVFAQLQKKFGRDAVYILTSNDQSSAKSPFNFSDKYQLITAAGIPGDRIIETNKMYVLPEGMDPTNTIFITAVGAPDADRLNPDTFLKKDRKDKEGNIIKPAGSPSYYKVWGGVEDPMTADQHGYVIVIPEIKKNVTLNGQTYDVSHGTECRNLWNQVRNDEKARNEFLKALYGKATPELVHIFNKVPDVANEDVDLDTIAEGSLNEFAPDEGGGSRKFIPWPEFIEQVKQIVGKDFACKESIVKTTIKARFIPHDPMEYGPTLLYSYYETRGGGRNKGAISTRGSIQVGKYSRVRLAGATQDQLMGSFSLLKGHPFERHFDLTFDNIYKIANIIMGNTQGALEFKPEQVAEGGFKNMYAEFSGYGNYMQGRAVNVFKKAGLEVVSKEYSEDDDIQTYVVKGDRWAIEKAGEFLKRNPEQFGGFHFVKQGVAEDAAGVGVVATNKKMAKDPRYSMSMTKDVKPSTPNKMLRAFKLAEDEDFGDFDRAVATLKESKQTPELPELLVKFLPIAMKELKVSKLPQIKLEKHIEAHDGQATFGRFVNDENVIHLAIADRHPLDILRTLAHELVHYKQFVNDELNQDSGVTGSPEENEAHATAGVIMRHFNKAYPELIKLNPINMN